MRKIYVVVKQGYEYNDEYNILPEGGGGKPEVAFESLEDAKKAVRDLSIIQAREDELTNYEYNGSDSYHEKILEYYKSLLNSKDLKAFDKWRMPIKEYFKDEDILKLINSYGIKYYKIVETNLK